MTAGHDAAGVLLAGLAGAPGVEVAVRDFSVPRAVLRARQLLLPPPGLDVDAARSQRLQRAAIAHAAAHLRYSQPAQSTRKLKPLAQAVVGAIEDARVEFLLAHAYPGVRRWFQEFRCAREADARLDFASLLQRLDRLLADTALQDDNHWVNRARDLFFSGPDPRDAQAFRAMALVLANELGQMRVPFDPQGYVVHAAYRDDNTYLWDHGKVAEAMPLPEPEPEAEAEAEAEAERNAGAGGRGDGSTASPERTPDTLQAPSPQWRRHHYAEWDHRLARARTQWCTVLEEAEAPRGSPTAPAGGAGTHATPRSASPARRRATQRAQSTGDELDLAAAVAGWVDRRRGQACDTRWFLRRPPLPLRASVLLLLDLSASTADLLQSPRRVDTRTVLDAEKHTALLLARQLLAQGHRVAIHGFSSNTRAAVRYRRVLEFGAALGPAAVAAVQALDARHSTRLGTALRHALECIAGEPGQRRTVLLLTDGAPSDIDVFDQDYLVEDARVAAWEARRARVHLSCMAFDARAQPRLRTIFGSRRLRVVTQAPLQSRQLWKLCEGTLIA